MSTSECQCHDAQTMIGRWSGRKLKMRQLILVSAHSLLRHIWPQKTEPIIHDLICCAPRFPLVLQRSGRMLASLQLTIKSSPSDSISLTALPLPEQLTFQFTFIQHNFLLTSPTTELLLDILIIALPSRQLFSSSD